MAEKTTASAKRRRRKSVPSRRTTTAGRGGGRRWSQDVTEHSDALTLDQGVFTWSDPKRIAASLKRSAEQSRRLYENGRQAATQFLDRLDRLERLP